MKEGGEPYTTAWSATGRWAPVVAVSVGRRGDHMLLQSVPGHSTALGNHDVSWPVGCRAAGAAGGGGGSILPLYRAGLQLDTLHVRMRSTHSLTQACAAIPTSTHCFLTAPQYCCYVCCCPQFWVWSMYDAFRNGRAGVKPLSGAQLAAESSRGNGQFTCVPSKIKS